MAALSCLLDSVRRDIKKVDRELRQLRCIDELSARCLCDLYMHPYCCCDLHPYPYCLCYSNASGQTLSSVTVGILCMLAPRPNLTCSHPWSIFAGRNQGCSAPDSHLINDYQLLDQLLSAA